MLGPFGNTDSDIKIAYSIGMHPLESKAHKALFDTVNSKSSSLNYCYYIYKINVTNYDTDDEVFSFVLDESLSFLSHDTRPVIIIAAKIKGIAFFIFCFLHI